MKNLNFLRSTLAALSLAFLGACSTSQYTFAPGTGSYHETIAKKQTEQKAEPLALADASADIHSTGPQAEIITSPKAEAASALAQTVAANNKLQASETAISSETKTDKKAARETVKKLKTDLKKLQKKVKDSQETKASVNKTAIVLIIIGLILALLGGGSLLGAIGVIFIVVGLVLILLDIL
jgi:hypothetical protein